MKKALLESTTNIDKDFPRRVYHDTEKEKLLLYMNTKGELFAAAGYIDDLVTGSTTRIANGGFRDEKYEWSSQDVYHIKKYNAAVTDDFLEHVLSQTS